MVAHLDAIDGIVRRRYQRPNNAFLFQGADIFQAIEREFFQRFAFARDIRAQASVGSFFLTNFFDILSKRIPTVFVDVDKGFIRLDFRQWFNAFAGPRINFIYIGNQIPVLLTTAGAQQQGRGD